TIGKGAAHGQYRSSQSNPPGSTNHRRRSAGAGDRGDSTAAQAHRGDLAADAGLGLGEPTRRLLDPTDPTGRPARGGHDSPSARSPFYPRLGPVYGTLLGPGGHPDVRRGGGRAGSDPAAATLQRGLDPRQYHPEP